jgi:hypothetical protein
MAPVLKVLAILRITRIARLTQPETAGQVEEDT